MRTTLFLLFTCLLSIHAEVAKSQTARVSIKRNNVTLETILNDIEKQTDYLFVYSDNVNAKQKVSLNVTNESVTEVLNGIFDSKISYVFEDNHIVLSAISSASNSVKGRNADGKIIGKVKDIQGEPIIGASVVIKGTNYGTITDIDGNFSLEGSDKGTLIISYIGYISQNIVINGKKEYVIVLKEDNKTLEEVVVVGYGTQKKSSVTGSIVTTKGEDLAAVPTTNVTNTLSGRMPGLITYTRSGEPGYDDAGLLIRGASTTGDSSPLIVVDGVADRAGGFSRIDPNDIESISVLKDASAAIYGSRAANGVILVTTKRGKGGKVSVNYSGNLGFSTPTTLPEMCSSWEYATLRNEIRTTVPGQSGTPDYTAEQIQKFKDGTDSNYPNVDIFDEMLRPAVQTQHNISVNGSGEKVDFYVSLGYQYQDNYYKNSASNYNQYNLRSNIDIRPNKNMKIGVNLASRQEDRNSPIYGSEDIWRYLIKYDPCVNLTYPGTNYPTINAAQDNFHPLTGVDNTMGYSKNKASYFNADLTLHMDMPYLTDGLSLDLGVYVDRSDTFYKQFQKRFYLYGENNGEYAATAYGPSNASLNENMAQTLGITMNARLNYKHTFNKVHNVSGFVAYEQYTSRYDYLQGSRSNFVSTSVDQLFAGSATTKSNDGTAKETARQNYFGRVDYDYAGRYLFEFNWRYDGSENFPKGNRFGFFPGVSLGWRVSEESFWIDHVPGIDYLKLRASWGQMGNDNVAKFQYITAYTFANSGIFNSATQTGVWLNRTANPNITWEVANTYNVGLEAHFLKDFSAELDIFKTKRNNILATRNAAIPGYAGLSLPDENIGKCSSTGFELSMNWNKHITKDWQLRLGGNLSYAKSKIEYIDEPESTLEWQKRTGSSIGTDGGMYLMYEADGIFRTQEELDAYPHLSTATVGDLRFKDINGDNTIDSNDKVRQDKPNVPRIMYGINLGVQYKNWSLNALFQGAAQVWQYTFMEAGIIGNFTQDFFDNRWTADNIDAKYPKVYNRDYTPSGGGEYRNTFWLNNASYLRLKSLELSYSLPQSIINNLGVGNVRFALTGYNLLTFTGLKNIDPEIADNSQGWAAWCTPQSKVINFGVNVTF